MARRANGPVDFQTALQGRAVISAERSLEGKIAVAWRQLFHFDRTRSRRGGRLYGRRNGFLRVSRRGREGGKHKCEHRAPDDHRILSEPCGALISTELPMLSGSGLGFSVHPTIGMITRKKAK